MTYDRSKTVGRVAFLAHREAIRSSLEMGHRNKEVFSELEGQLAISYSQFNRYVARYITGGNSDVHQRKSVKSPAPISSFATSAPTTERKVENTDTQAASRIQKRPVFVHDPTSGNRRDDLI